MKFLYHLFPSESMYNKTLKSRFPDIATFFKAFFKGGLGFGKFSISNHIDLKFFLSYTEYPISSVNLNRAFRSTFETPQLISAWSKLTSETLRKLADKIE